MIKNGLEAEELVNRRPREPTERLVTAQVAGVRENPLELRPAKSVEVRVQVDVQVVVKRQQFAAQNWMKHDADQQEQEKKQPRGRVAQARSCATARRLNHTRHND